MATAKKAQARLRSFTSSQQASQLARFFKTGPGQYGEGDRFLGVMVPQTRLVAREFQDLDFPEIQRLLKSPFHEDRLLGLVILVLQFEKGTEAHRKRVFNFYVRSKAAVNNWDLVDVTAPKIVGPWLQDRPKGLLRKWVQSSRLWDRRLAVLSTFAFFRRKDFALFLEFARILLNDPEDLMHKAVGWGLREVGKRDEATLRAFLDRHGRKMPRTMLRYAIERLPSTVRRRYLMQTK